MSVCLRACMLTDVGKKPPSETHLCAVMSAGEKVGVDAREGCESGSISPDSFFCM